MIVLDKLQKILEVINRLFALKSCTSVGTATRVAGKVTVSNSGKIRIGSFVKFRGTQVPIELCTHPDGDLIIGDKTMINSGVSICSVTSVKIGKNCGIGNYSLIMDTDFHTVGDFNTHPTPEPVTIGDNVWIAAHVVVLKGVTIGEGSVVAACSVVVDDIPPYCLYGGNPAKFIRSIDPPTASEKKSKRLSMTTLPIHFQRDSSMSFVLFHS